LGDRFAVKPSRTDAAFDNVLMRAGEQGTATAGAEVDDSRDRSTARVDAPA
jgi:hypothetical protein